MEPKNEGLEDDIPFQTKSFSGSSPSCSFGQPRSQLPVPPANMASAGCNPGFPTSQGGQILVDFWYVYWGCWGWFWSCSGWLQITDKEVAKVLVRECVYNINWRFFSPPNLQQTIFFCRRCHGLSALYGQCYGRSDGCQPVHGRSDGWLTYGGWAVCRWQRWDVPWSNSLVVF